MPGLEQQYLQLVRKTTAQAKDIAELNRRLAIVFEIIGAVEENQLILKEEFKELSGAIDLVALKDAAGRLQGLLNKCEGQSTPEPKSPPSPPTEPTEAEYATLLLESAKPYIKGLADMAYGERMRSDNPGEPSHIEKLSTDILDTLEDWHKK